MFHAIAIDDEPVALSIIKNYCERLGDISLETYTNPRIGLQKIIEEKPDIVFLDIEMNGMTGMEIARELPPTACLIFTTAYAEYAVDSYEVNAVDFLHKPFFYPRFVKAIDKATQWIKMRKVTQLTRRPERVITLKVEYKNVTVSIDSIMYIESMDNYVKLHLLDGSTLISQISLKKIEEMLPAKEFIRVHRSYLVSVAKIERYTRQSIKLVDRDEVIPVGRNYGAEIGDFLKDKLRLITRVPELFDYKK